MGLFDKKSKKDDFKAAKQQNEEERIKKELETLAAILDKTDSAAQEKPAVKAPVAEKPAERVNTLKPAVKAPVAEKPSEKPPAMKEPPKASVKQAIPAQKPILKPNILQSQPIPTQKAAPPEKELAPVRQAPTIKEREEAHPKPERVTQAVAQPDVQVLNLLKGQMERQASETEKQRKELEKLREEAQAQREEYGRQMAAIVDKLQKLDAYKEEIKPEDIRMLQAGLHEQKSTIESQSLTLSSIGEELAQLKEFDLENYAEQERQVLQKLAAEIKTLKDSLGGFSSDTEQARNSVAVVDSKINSLREEITRLTEEIKAVRAGSEEGQSVYNDVKALKSQLADTRNENKALGKTLQSLNDSVANAKARLDEQVNDHIAELSFVKGNMTDFKNEMKPIKLLVDKYGEKVKALKDYSGLEEEIKALKGDSKTIKDFIGDYKDEMESIRGLIEQFKNDAEHATPQEAKLIKAGQYLKTQIDQVNNTFADLDERLSAVRKEFINLNNIEYRYRALEDNLNAMERNLENKIEVEMITRVREAENDLVVKISGVEERVLEQSKASHETVKELREMQTSTVNLLKQTQSDVLGSVSNVKSEAVKSVTEAVNEATSSMLKGRDEVLKAVGESRSDAMETVKALNAVSKKAEDEYSKLSDQIDQAAKATMGQIRTEVLAAIKQEKDGLSGTVESQKKQAVDEMTKFKDGLIVSLRQTESIVLSSTDNARIVAEKSMVKTRDEILESIRHTREETIKKLLDTRDVVIAASNNSRDVALEQMFKTRDEVIKTTNDTKTSMRSTRDEVLKQLKATQKEVEDTITKKIEADKENTEKIKQIMKTMNELIKA